MGTLGVVCPPPAAAAPAREPKSAAPAVSAAGKVSTTLSDCHTNEAQGRSDGVLKSAPPGGGKVSATLSDCDSQECGTRY